MDIELLKSAPEDQIDMMHTDKSTIIANGQHHIDSPMMSFSKNMTSSHSLISFSNNNESENNYTIPSYSYNSPAPMSSLKQPSMGAMREMIFKIAAMQPIYIDPEAVKPPKRRNVKISKDPQSVAARHRRERISEKMRILQRLVPGGTKLDTASMLDEAIHYVKFLRSQLQSLQSTAINGHPLFPVSSGLGFPVAMSAGGSYFPSTTASKTDYS